jgi:transposase
MIRDRTPDQLKFPFALLTREAVRELIKKLFGVDYSLNMVGVLLADWGFTPQKPVVRSLEPTERRGDRAFPGMTVSSLRQEPFELADAQCKIVI